MSGFLNVPSSSHSQLRLAGCFFCAMFYITLSNYWCPVWFRKGLYLWIENQESRPCFSLWKPSGTLLVLCWVEIPLCVKDQLGTIYILKIGWKQCPQLLQVLYILLYVIVSVIKVSQWTSLQGWILPLVFSSRYKGSGPASWRIGASNVDRQEAYFNSCSFSWSRVVRGGMMGSTC